MIKELLPVGKENAISSIKLMQLSGCRSVRELQKKIAEERKHGAVICSGAESGYWKPKDREEIKAFVRTMDARAKNIFAVSQSARRALELPDGQQEMTGRLNDGK